MECFINSEVLLNNFVCHIFSILTLHCTPFCNKTQGVYTTFTGTAISKVHRRKDKIGGLHDKGAGQGLTTHEEVRDKRSP